jgi:sulfate transport system substrate-binding protein
VAQAYLEYLASLKGQEIAAKHHYRPRDPDVLKKYQSSFAEVKLFTIGDAFGGWQAASKTHFGNGAIFDQIYQPGAK